MSDRSRVIQDPETNQGKPTIQGTNVKTSDVWRLLKKGNSVDDILGMNPDISRDDVVEIIAFENGGEERKHEIFNLSVVIAISFVFVAEGIIGGIIGVGYLSVDTVEVTSWLLAAFFGPIGVIFIRLLLKKIRSRPQRKPLPVFEVKHCTQCKKEYDDWPGFGIGEREYAKYCKTCRGQAWRSSVKTGVIFTTIFFIPGIIFLSVFKQEGIIILYSLIFIGLGVTAFCMTIFYLLHKPCSIP